MIFEQCLDILGTINADNDLNKDNVIEKIKEKLKATDPATYEEWKENNFDIDTDFNADYDVNTDYDVDNVSNIKSGRTLLHFAAEGGYIKIVNSLVEKRANINAVDEDGKTPLHFAVEGGYIEIVNALVGKKAKISVKDKNKESPLDLAIKGQRKEIINIFTNNKENVNAVDENKRTPLHSASEFGNTELTHDLIEKGANINAVDENKRTPVCLAVRNGHKEIFYALKEKGADLLLGNINGRNLRYLAESTKNDSSKHFPGKAKEEQVDGEYELLKYSVLFCGSRPLIDIMREDTFDHLISTWFAEIPNLTPSQKKLNKELLSIFKNYPSFIDEGDYIARLKKFLQDNQNDKDLIPVLNLKRGESKSTILHLLASINGPLVKKCIDLLLKAGANPDIQNDRGTIPLDVAADNHNCHLESCFLSDEEKILKRELYNTFYNNSVYKGGNFSGGDVFILDKDLTKLKEFLNKYKDNQGLKKVLNLHDDEGKSQIFQHIRHVFRDYETSCKEAEELLLKAGAIDYERLDRKECLPEFGTLWDNLIPNQQEILKFFLYRVGKAQDINELEQVVNKAIEFGMRFNFPHQGKLYGKMYEKYGFMDYVIKRIKEISELKKNPKVASDIVCKLVSRGAMLYVVNSIDIFNTLELEFKDHKTNMIKAREEHVNNTLEFMEIVKSAATGRVKNAKMDNSTFYLEYSEDSTINVAKITDGARNLGLTQGEIGYGRDIIKIGKSEVEIITAKGIRHYTDLADNSDIALTFHTSLGELEVNLYPDKQDKDKIIVEVSNKKEILEKFKNCKEELGKNCSFNGYSVYDAIEQGYFERSGKLMRSEAMSQSNGKTGPSTKLDEIRGASSFKETVSRCI